MLIWRNADPKVLAALLVFSARRYADARQACDASSNPPKSPPCQLELRPTDREKEHVQRR